jgi:hypothetical protein
MKYKPRVVNTTINWYDSAQSNLLAILIDIQNRIQEILNITPGCTTADGQFTLETVNYLGACALAPSRTKTARRKKSSASITRKKK